MLKAFARKPHNRFSNTAIKTFTTSISSVHLKDEAKSYEFLRHNFAKQSGLGVGLIKDVPNLLNARRDILTTGFNMTQRERDELK